MSKKMVESDSWMLRRFPDLNPKAIVESGLDERKTIDPEEYRRASWLWKRRPTEITLLLYLLILGIGALGHAIFILFSDPIYLVVYHLLYVAIVVTLVGRFLWSESRCRKWKQDYLRSVARLEEGESRGAAESAD